MIYSNLQILTVMEMARTVVILALVGFNAVQAAMFVRLAWICIFNPVANTRRYDLQVEQPFGGSTCHGNRPCTVTWLDDGSKPLVSDLGICEVGLYTGQQVWKSTEDTTLWLILRLATGTANHTSRCVYCALA
jgi:hypothetical protein